MAIKNSFQLEKKLILAKKHLTRSYTLGHAEICCGLKIGVIANMSFDTLLHKQMKFLLNILIAHIVKLNGYPIMICSCLFNDLKSDLNYLLSFKDSYG